MNNHETENPYELWRLRLPRRFPAAGAFAFDVTDPNHPVPLGQVVSFFGLADSKNVPELSKQWLTEVTIAKDDIERQSIEKAAIEEKERGTPIGKRLSMQKTYSCSGVGANLRILTTDLNQTDQTYSYIIVDEEDGGSEGPMLVSEIWLAKCDNPALSELKPASVRGKKLLSQDRKEHYVIWEAIAFRIANTAA